MLGGPNVCSLNDSNITLGLNNLRAGPVRSFLGSLSLSNQPFYAGHRHGWLLRHTRLICVQAVAVKHDEDLVETIKHDRDLAAAIEHESETPLPPTPTAELYFSPSLWLLCLSCLNK
ncbi:hypothetical protein CsSME_00006785 [Camellia sinensis var. sinensis]